MQIPYFDTPYEAVFVKHFGKGNKPLFERQVELADEIRNNPKSGFQNKLELTVRSAISQIFTGERNLSHALKGALLIAIEKRFDKRTYDYKEFEQSLIEKFRTAYDERMAYKRDHTADRDYDTLIAATKSGSEFLITTLEPAELHKSELANRLKNELLEKTKIAPKSSREIEPGKYKFFLPDKENGRVAREFWESLRKHAMNEYNMSFKEVDKKLKRANEEKTILTFLAPVEIAMHPYVFINYNDFRKVTGFCVSYRDNEIPSVAELSLKVVYEWFLQYQIKLEKVEADVEKNFKY